MKAYIMYIIRDIQKKIEATEATERDCKDRETGKGRNRQSTTALAEHPGDRSIILMS